jgi:hypothetical protein
MQANAIFEDMLAVGLQPERETFHLLLKVCSLLRINPRVFIDFGIGPFALPIDNSVVTVE